MKLREIWSQCGMSYRYFNTITAFSEKGIVWKISMSLSDCIANATVMQNAKPCTEHKASLLLVK